MAQTRNPYPNTDPTKPTATKMARLYYGCGWQDRKGTQLVVSYMETCTKVFILVVDDTVCVMDGDECTSTLTSLLGGSHMTLVILLIHDII